jgi:hypothetical protein
MFLLLRKGIVQDITLEGKRGMVVCKTETIARK